MPQKDLRARISYVPQKAWLFSGTIAENLRYGDPLAEERQMEHALAVRCDARSISEALNLLDTVIRPRANRLTAHSETPAFNQEITAIWEVRHLTLLAEAMLRASEARHESRGSLQRLDYPARDDERFLAHSMIGMADAADAEASSAPHASILWQSVHIDDFPPKTREY